MSLSIVRRPTAETWLLLGLLALFVGLSIHHCSKASKHKSAILRWQSQLLALESGEDISARFNYPNPPIMAVLLEPLAYLPPLATALVWFYLKVGLALLSLALVFRLIAPEDVEFPLWAKILTVLLAFRPILGDLQHGNVNLFILFLVVSFLYSLAQGKNVLGGVILGLAIACKVTPALFVPYLVWKRSWWALGGCVLGLALFLWPGFVPATRLGWKLNQTQLASWYQGMVQPFLVEGKVTSEHPNQSLPGVAFRLLTHSPSHVIYPGDVWTPSGYHNLASLDPLTVKRMVQGCMLLFAGLVVMLCRTPTTPPAGWRLAAEYSVIVVGMLLFSERTWKHHAVTLVLPFAVLSFVLATQPIGRQGKIAVGTTLGVVALLMALTSQVPGLWEDARAEWFQVFGTYTLAFVLLLIALFAVLAWALKARGDNEVSPSLAPGP